MSLETILNKGKKLFISSLIATNIIALYNCNKNPANDYVPDTDEPAEEFYLENTDSDGQVVLDDNVIINVLDNSTDEGIENISIGVINKEDYGVITALDTEEKYFPSIKFLDNLGNDTVFLYDVQNGSFKLDLSEEEQNICFKFFRDNLENESLSKTNSEECSPYKFTYSGEQRANEYLIVDGLMNALGAGFAMTIAGEAASLLNLIEEENLQEYILNNNWDHYTFIGSPWLGGDLDENLLPKISFTVPSNQPGITLEELITDDPSEVYFKFNYFDENYYENQINEDYAIDRTIFCRGSQENDLLVKYSVFDQSDNLVLNDSTMSDEVYVDIPSTGNYNLKLEVFDDTRFKDVYDDSGINKNEIDTLITVGGNLLTLIESDTIYGNSFQYDITSDEDYIWAGRCNFNNNCSLYKYDKETKELSFHEDFLEYPTFFVSEITSKGENIYADNWMWHDSDVFVYNKFPFYLTEVIPFEDGKYHSRHSCDEGFVVSTWENEGTSTRIQKMNDDLSEIIQEFGVVNEKLKDIAYDGVNYWGVRCNYEDMNLLKYDSDFNLIDSTKLDYFKIPVCSITYDGEYLWYYTYKGEDEDFNLLNKYEIVE